MDYGKDWLESELENAKEEILSLTLELEAERARVEHLNKEWLKYRKALNRIAHPETYKVNGGYHMEIARTALVIGMDVDELPHGASKDKDKEKEQA
tara:strand:+ start:1458 stop:1745 length:288 start_codon:yes stop_codon:yes gene_type:complete